jgi:zinc protease
MRFTKRIAYACIVVLCMPALYVNGQYDPSRKLPSDENVKVGQLPNGLKYYIRKNALPAKKVQLRLIVNTGSVLEDPDQLGLAHFMEHMNFNGLKHFPKNELVNYLQSIGVQFGADLNAYTSFDETVYFLPIPSDDPEKVEKGFTILEDWAFNALLDDAEIEKERGVVLEESRLAKGAQERMSKKYYPVLFNGSMYAERLPIGKDSILQHFKPEVLKRFYKTWYRPDLMAVIVVGDIDVNEAEQKIKDHFSSYSNPTGEKKRVVAEIPGRKQNQSMVLTDKEVPYNVIQIYNYVEKSQPTTTWGEYRRSAGEFLFNNMINQRLAEISRKPDAPFLQAGTSFGNFVRGYRSFNSFAVAGDKPVKNAIETLISVVESVKKYGFLPAELQRAKTALLTNSERQYNDRDKTESIRFLSEYQNNFLIGSHMMGYANSYNQLKETLPLISLEEVNALAKKTESPQGFFALITGPEKSASTLPSNDDLTAMIAAARTLPIRAYEEKAIATTLMEKKPAPGKITGEKANTELGTTELTLSNGVTITLKPTDFKNDEIHMDAWRQGGSRNYPLADKKNAELAGPIVRAMGIRDMTATDITKFLSGKTVTATPYANAYDEGIEGRSSVKDFETFLQLVHLYITAPGRDPNSFQSFINAQKAMRQNMKSVPGAYFSDTLNKVLYANSPWAGGMESPEVFDKVSLDRVMEIYREIFGNVYGMHFTFIGNIDMATVKPLLETYLGSLPAAPKTNKFTDEGLRPVKGVVRFSVKKGAAKQSQVNVLFTGETKYNKEEELKLKALTDVLNIKVIEKLREEMGGIYGGGFSSAFARRPYGNYTIYASFPCGPENVDKLTTALFDIIRSAREKGIEQSDLDKVKETMNSHLDDQLKNNDFWLTNLSYAFIENFDPAWILNIRKSINSITAAELKVIANRYFDMNNYVVGVLNPEN